MGSLSSRCRRFWLGTAITIRSRPRSTRRCRCSPALPRRCCFVGRWSVAFGMGLHPEGTVAALAARGQRTLSVTAWLVGPLGNAARLHRSVSRRVVLSLLKGAHWIAPETLDAAQELIDLGLSRERLTIVDAGIDLRRFRPRRQADHRGDPDGHGRKLAVYAGRFDLRQKRLDLLLDAWQAAALVGWELVLAGAGEDEIVVHRKTQALDGVHVLGWQADVARSEEHTSELQSLR